MDHGAGGTSMEFTDLPDDVKASFQDFFSDAKEATAAERYDALEIRMRRRCLELLGVGSLPAVIEYWRHCLLAVHRAVQCLEQHDAAGKKASSETTKSTETNNDHDSKMTDDVATTPAPNTAVMDQLVEMKHHVRKLPILLMEDILDTLETSQAVSFWSEVVVPSNELLFGDLLWRNTMDPKKKPCWLVFLRVSNKFLRSLRAEEQFVEASKVSRLLSMVYPLSEKSTMRGFGSHNTDHLTVLDSEEEFEQQQTESAKEGSSTTATGYSFYETFWKLQHDFRNPNAIIVVDFIRRLTTVLRSFQSHMISSSHASTTKTAETNVAVQPYLTQSRILPIQLSDPAMRTLVLTQFWIVSQHLMPKVPALRVQLEPHVRTAETLLPPDHLKLLKESSLFLRSEPQWKQWKQDKCLPDLDEARKPAPKPKTKRTSHEANNAQDHVAEEPALEHVSKKMRATAPLSNDHMEEFVDAIDPEAGIEEEYHPKNNAVYSWRALRLLSHEHLEDFALIQSNGDFENMIRHVYKTKHDVSIPGEPLPDIPIVFEDPDSKTNVETETLQDTANETMADQDEDENVDGAKDDTNEVNNNADQSGDDEMDVESQPAAKPVKEEDGDEELNPAKEDATGAAEKPVAERNNVKKESQEPIPTTTQVADKEVESTDTKEELAGDTMLNKPKPDEDSPAKSEETKAEPIKTTPRDDEEKQNDKDKATNGTTEKTDTNGKTAVEPKQEESKPDQNTMSGTKRKEPPDDAKVSNGKSASSTNAQNDEPRGTKRPIHEIDKANHGADARRGPNQRAHEDPAGPRYDRRPARLPFVPPPGRGQPDAHARPRPNDHPRGGDSRGRAGDNNTFRDNRPRHDSRGRGRPPNDRRPDDRPNDRRPEERPEDRRDNRVGARGRDDERPRNDGPRPRRGGWNKR